LPLVFQDAILMLQTVDPSSESIEFVGPGSFLDIDERQEDRLEWLSELFLEPCAKVIFDNRFEGTGVSHC
jgi:hypothetical protein